MEGGNLTLNASEFFESLTPAFIEKISPLITILKAVGIVLLVYILFLIARAVLNLRMNMKISNISKNVEEINKKLDSIIPQKDKEKIEKKKK